MRYSIRLIAERLRARGVDAFVGRGAETSCSKMRLLDGDTCSFEPDTLYVAKELPAGVPEDAGCAFALLQPPSPDAAAPWLALGNPLSANVGENPEGANPSGVGRVLPQEESAAAAFGANHATPHVESVAALANALAEVVDELDSALAHASEAAWDDDGVQQVVDVLAELLGNPVYVVDSSFKVIAITNDPDMEEMSINWMHAARHGYVSYDVVAGLIRSDELHDIESSKSATRVESEFFYTPFANYNLRHAGKVRGHLFAVEMYKEVTPGDLQVIDLMAPSVMRAMRADPSFQAQRGELYEHFVTGWLEGDLTDSSYILRQLDALSFDATSHSLVAIVRMSDASDFKRGHLARLLEDRQECRAVHHDGSVVALFQLKKREEKEGVLRKVRAICRSQHCRASMSEVQDSLLDTPRAYRQAREALRIMDAMQLPDDVVRYGDVAAYQPYLNFASAEELDTFLHPAIVTLREYDRSHAVKLLPSLSAYLKNDRDVQVTARELFIHRNTLAYRMKRILEMCPLDLDDFNTRHRLLESILIVENYAGITARFYA